jgi:hypothetical protein
MKSIPKDQKCQAFDPMLIFPEKTYKIIKNPMNANTSCFAPASVFMDGIHGTRYLCDYHYQFEKDITMNRTPDLWPVIANKVIDERDQIKETFDKNTKTNETSDSYCWCKKQAFVKIISKEEIGGVSFFCNFHFRKFYYRNYSNYVIFEDIYQIIDERYKMTISVVEEAEQSDLVI